MKRSPQRRNGKPRGGNLLLAIGLALVVVLLLLRMIALVVGHGRHHF